MYIGHGRLCVCVWLSVPRCIPITARPLLAMLRDAAKNVLLLATSIDAQPPAEHARLQSVSIC